MKAQHAILRFAKYKGPTISRIEAHNERTKEFYASNPDIKTELSKNNFHLVKPNGKYREEANRLIRENGCKARKDSVRMVETVPFPVSWTVKMKKKQKETQDILSYHTQAAGCSDKARAKASGGRQPIEECGRTGL